MFNVCLETWVYCLLISFCSVFLSLCVYVCVRNVMEITFITLHYIACLCSCLSVCSSVQGGSGRSHIQCSVCGWDVFRIDVHLREWHGLHSGSEEYKRARDVSNAVNRTASSGGPAADLDTIMESFQSFLTSMAGGDKHEPVALAFRREVRRVVEDLLAGEPYKPRLLMRLLTIGDEPTGLLEQYWLGTLRGRKQFKSGTFRYVSSLQHFIKFLQRECSTCNLHGTIDKPDMDKLSIVLSGCLTSLQKRRQLEDSCQTHQVDRQLLFTRGATYWEGGQEGGAGYREDREEEGGHFISVCLPVSDIQKCVYTVYVGCLSVTCMSVYMCINEFQSCLSLQLCQCLCVNGWTAIHLCIYLSLSLVMYLWVEESTGEDTLSITHSWWNVLDHLPWHPLCDFNPNTVFWRKASDRIWTLETFASH